MLQPLTLTVDDLSCLRGERLVFTGVSFTLAAGEALLVTGPNGAGKTSLLRVLAGLLPRHDGKVQLQGAEDDASPGELCHYLGHANAIKGALSLRENLDFAASFLGDRSMAAGEALGRFGLGALADLPSGLLSAGQKRKLALARLFLVRRPLWFLDEPSVSLDTGSVKTLEKAIGSHLKQGGIAVVASHTPIKLRFAHRLALGKESGA